MTEIFSECFSGPIVVTLMEVFSVLYMNQLEDNESRMNVIESPNQALNAVES